MKKFLLLLCMLYAGNTFSQGNLHCGSDDLMKRFYQSNPDILKKRLENEEKNKNRRLSSSQSAYVIPVVFHIMHTGGPENISDAQVKDGLRILNRDFAKQNPDTIEIIPSFQSIADSTGIAFQLATLDPNGNCTSGIIHHYDSDADWNEFSTTLYQHTWDPTKYMNVYIVRSITLGSGFGAAGYTYFPGSFSPGDPMDAIVVLNNYFGSIGTGDPFLSRVLTHEVGHWLNLSHVFGYNSAATDCFNDDYVNDTPTTPGYLSCPDANNTSSYQQCTPGVDENFQNYMDYSYCCKMFTHGQAERMEIALFDNIAGRDNLWSPGNLIVTGVINPLTCIPYADFSYSRNVTCIGTAVTFNDASWNAQPTSYSWTFPGGNPSASTLPNPVVNYNSAGLYSATLTVSNSNGTSSPVTKTNIIKVVSSLNAYQNSWNESFETFPIPNNDWTLSNSGTGANWFQSFDAAYTGIFSAELSSVGNTRKAVTSMISPAVNLSGINFPVLKFKVAAAEINPLHLNTLKVYASVDCENSWTEIYSKTGSDLISSSDTSSPFIPFSLSDWRSETIPLSNFSSATEAKFRFTYMRDTIPTPSNIFIDDINITTSTALAENNNEFKIVLSPNPAKEHTTLTLSITEKSKIEILLTDLTGKVVKQITDAEFQAGTYHFIIAAGNISSASYIVKISINGKTEIRKLIIY